MQKVRCVDCGKTYDYDEDAFCPKCGGFNQPARGARLAHTKRVNGLSEAGHQGSFLHREFHEEERERRRVGLDQNENLPIRGTVSRPVRQSSARTNRKNPVSIIVWVIFAIIAFNILSSLLFLLF